MPPKPARVLVLTDTAPTLSVIVPTLDAAPLLDRTLAIAGAAASAFEMELIVADGGSTDGTLDIASNHGARVVRARPGRGGQLAAGAAAAQGDWLLFLHADTRLPAGWQAAAAEFIADPQNAERAAYFRFALDDRSAGARRLEWLVALRVRLLALPYGDQGLLLSRAFYDALGGFRAIPLMEDVDLMRRIGRRRLIAFDGAALTSAARYRSGGYIGRPLRNLCCLALYFLGLPPRLIARLYA